MTTIATSAELAQKKCLPCEGGVEPCSLSFSERQLQSVPNWKLDGTGQWISRSVRAKNFVRALECLNAIGQLAEQEGHHPDLHLIGYRILRIELTTHAISGLSENDFIIAAKIDRILAERFPEIKVDE